MSNSFVTPWTVAHQGLLSTGFPRQESWSGLPFPPGDLPYPRIKPMSPTLAGGYFTTELPRKIHTYMYVAAAAAKSLQSCLALCDPIDGSPPDSSVQGISQARILEWVALSSSRGSSQLRDRTSISCVSFIGRWVLYHKHHLGSSWNIIQCPK